MERDELIAEYGDLVVGYLDTLVELAGRGDVGSQQWNQIAEKLKGGARITIDLDVEAFGLTAYDDTGRSLWTIS